MNDAELNAKCREFYVDGTVPWPWWMVKGIVQTEAEKHDLLEPGKIKNRLWYEDVVFRASRNEHDGWILQEYIHVRWKVGVWQMISRAQEHVASCINRDWLQQQLREQHVSVRELCPHRFAITRNVGGEIDS